MNTITFYLEQHTQDTKRKAYCILIFVIDVFNNFSNVHINVTRVSYNEVDMCITGPCGKSSDVGLRRRFSSSRVFSSSKSQDVGSS